MKKRIGLLAACLCMLVLTACGTKTKENALGSYVDLGEYKGIEITKEPAEVTDEELDGEIEGVLKQNATYDEIKEGTVKKGDTVNIDYVGKKDGVAFEGGTAQGYALTIGSGSFIDGFEDGLIGAKVGSTVDLKLTFPDPYKDPDLAGKDVVFTVTVNFIQKENLPELTDEFVKGISEFGTVEEYKTDLKAKLAQQKEAKEKSRQRQELLSKLLEAANVKEYPQEQVDKYEENLRRQFEQQASLYQMDLEAFIGAIGMTQEDFDTEMEKEAKDGVAINMILDLIAEKEDIQYDADQLEQDSQNFVKNQGYDSVEAYEKENGDGTVKANLLRNKTVDFLMDNAKIKEA